MENGNMRADTLRKKFTAAAKKDTMPPRVLNVLPGNGAENIDFLPEIAINLNTPTDSNSIKKSFFLIGEKADTVSGKFNFINVLKPRFTPNEKLAENGIYKIEIMQGSLKDLYGAEFYDTLLTNSFTVKSLQDVGAISGRIFFE